MRRRVIVLAVGVVLAIGVGVLGTTAAGDDQGPATSEVPGLDTRTVAAGAVDVEITPRRLDDRGAVFAVSLDTHTVELSADLAAEATLEVDGVAWPVERWSGDGPGGHHREGDLSFTAAGPATGELRLVIGGLPEPVDAAWTLERRR